MNRQSHRLTKQITLALLVFLAATTTGAPSPADAHITGVFKYFLKDVEEGTASSRLLTAQIEQTNRRLQELQPELAAARAAYEKAATPAREKMRFYNRHAGNLVGAMLVGSEDLVDTLANTYLIQRVVTQDVAQLRKAAQAYEQLRTKDRNLRQYRDLLQAIQFVRERRQSMLNSVPDTKADRELLLFDTGEDWEDMRESTFASYFEWATQQMKALRRVAEPTREGIWRISEQSWNRQLTGPEAPVKDGRFYLRADHIYFSGYLEGIRADWRHVFTVGLMNRVDATTIEYRLDAIYIDGFPVDPNDPDVAADIYEQNLLVIDGKQLDPGLQQLRFNQQNGSLELITN